jgi:phage tail sheath gpL-like
MALTSIGFQKTPGRPAEITFAGQTGLPANAATLIVVGHAASGATGVNTLVTINNATDPVAGAAEAATKFGTGSELAKAVLAAINANAGGSNFPKLVACVLASTDTTVAAAAQAAILKTVGGSEFISWPYDMNSDSTNRAVALNLAKTMSGAQRGQMQQYGTVAVGASRASDPSALFKMDTQYLSGCWLRDTSGSPAYSLAELAAAAAAVIAGNSVPFNPLDDVTVGSVPAPVSVADWPSVGAGLESETCLGQGWTPLWVKPNGEVAFVRTVTARLSSDGAGQDVVTAYYDIQDFQVLYFWRKTLVTRFSQPDFKRTKASAEVARDIKAEVIRLAQAFEDQNMFQAVAKLASQFIVQLNASDRSRFDVLTPVNVIPGLHVIASNIQATTQFDVTTV